MQYNAKAPYLVETHWQIDEVKDGDSIIISNLFTRLRKEIRLYGLDAPEVKYNRKMKEDEQKTRLAAQFLIQLGLEALHYVLKVAPPKTVVTIITEQDNFCVCVLLYYICSRRSSTSMVMLSHGYGHTLC